jgi:ribosomal-protein-alanine N-acetyltransferase
MTVLHTERLTLRPVTLADAPFVQAHFGHWNVLQFFSPPAPWPYPANGAEDFIQNVVLPKAAKGLCHNWIIELRATHTPIGSVAVNCKDEATGTWERGFWLAAEHRGHKYMEEASLAALRFVFTARQAKRVDIRTAPSNKASLRIKEKQGFTCLGVSPKSPPFHNGEDTQINYTLSAADFFRLHGA